MNVTFSRVGRTLTANRRGSTIHCSPGPPPHFVPRYHLQTARLPNATHAGCTGLPRKNIIDRANGSESPIYAVNLRVVSCRWETGFEIKVRLVRSFVCLLNEKSPLREEKVRKKKERKTNGNGNTTTMKM